MRSEDSLSCRLGCSGGSSSSSLLFASCGLLLAGLLSIGLNLFRSGELELCSREAPVLGAAGGVRGAWRGELGNALVVGLGGRAAVFHLFEEPSCVLHASGLATEELQAPGSFRCVELKGGGSKAQVREI